MEFCPICSISIFSRLNDQEVSDLRSIVKVREYQKGETVFRQGEGKAKLHMLFEGQLKSVRFNEDGKETVLHTIENGEPFALVPYFLNISYTGTCVTLKPSLVGEIERRDFLEVLKKSPEISLKIMASMAQRTKDLLTRIEIQSSLSPKERLLNYLKLEMNEINRNPFELPLTKADLARILGMEPETLSRCFSLLTKEEAIHVQKKMVTIL